MDAITLAARAHASTEQILRNVRPEQLAGPTHCPGWDVRTLVNHVIGANYFIAAIVNEQPVGDESDAPDFAAEDINAAYEQASKVMDAAWAQDGAFDKTYQAPFGPTPAQVLFAFGTTDQFVHGWDVAKATGQSTDLDADVATFLLGALSGAPLPRGAGMPFGAEVATTSEASIDRLVALLGRQP